MVLVKDCSRSRAESIASFSLFSAAAMCAWRKIRAFPISTANRSVGVGNLDLGATSSLVIEGLLFSMGIDGEGS